MIDLCIVSYNAKAQLERLLSGIVDTQYDFGEYKIYIADNGSTDNSVEYLQTMQRKYLPWLDVSYNENIGYSAACNQLAARGKGDIIALLNCDVWFTPNDLMSIQKAFDDDPDIAILGPKQRNEDGYITHAGIEGNEESCRPRAWKVYDPEDVYHRHLEEMVSVAGSAYFVRRSVWEDLTSCPIYQELYPGVEGAFLPTPHYYEETFCSYHARAHGYQVYYDGRISIGHSWHASHEIGSERDRMFQTSQAIFRQACDAHRIPHD